MLLALGLSLHAVHVLQELANLPKQVLLILQQLGHLSTTARLGLPEAFGTDAGCSMTAELARVLQCSLSTFTQDRQKFLVRFRLFLVLCRLNRLEVILRATKHAKLAFKSFFLQKNSDKIF